MYPARRRFITGRTAFAQRKAPFKLVPWIWSQSLSLVSSMGADSRSRIFYSRIKGELDEAVLKLPFRKKVILRPSLLVGQRENRRWAEDISFRIMGPLTKLFFKKYRPIRAATVAQAMIRAALEETQSGKNVYTLDEIFTLAGE